MKNLLIVVLFVIIAQSCATEKKCMEKFKMKPDTIRIVTVRDSLVYRDTTIFIKLPGELRIDSVPIPCPPPPPTYIPDTARAETTYAIAKAWWQYPNIALILIQKPITLELKLDSVIREAYHYRTEYEKIKQVIETKYVPKIYKDALGICIFLFAIAFIIFGWKLYKFFTLKK